LLANKLDNVDGAVQYLHLVRRFLRPFYCALHHAKLNTSILLDSEKLGEQNSRLNLMNGTAIPQYGTASQDVASDYLLDIKEQECH
jgi:hypothetical protein